MRKTSDFRIYQITTSIQLGCGRWFRGSANSNHGADRNSITVPPLYVLGALRLAPAFSNMTQGISQSETVSGVAGIDMPATQTGGRHQEQIRTGHAEFHQSR